MNNNKTRILITIDTEFSIGGYFRNKEHKPVTANKIIFCTIGKKEYGINLIMDILDKYNLYGIFFVEVESRFYFGEDEVLKIIRHIQSRGHEVQLHTHPNFRTFLNKGRTQDDMRLYDFNGQKQILSEAMEWLKKNGIKGIIAHRSGGFYSNADTLKAQMESGLKYSSNYNIAYPNCDYLNAYAKQNDIFKIDSLYEIPITCFKEFKMHKEWNSFQLSAASFEEIKNALLYYYAQGIQVVSYITHSFEFVKKSDEQYNSFKPLPVLIKRFDKLCRFIAENNDKFSVVSFGQLDDTLEKEKLNTNLKSYNFFKSGFTKTITRYIENKLFT